MKRKEGIPNTPGGEMTRRQFIFLSAGAVAGAALTGCATNPVSGKRQLMFVSQSEEINMDRERAPHQFSADYGPVLDPKLNAYVTAVGGKLSAVCHRPHMPYSFRVVNANHANAYTFPAGSIAVTRGLLLEMESESELAAVLGHEIAHVSARHTSQQMTKGILAQVLVSGVTEYVDREHRDYAPLAAALGSVGAGLLLARYSRENETEADELGMEYMVRCGYSPGGMVRLMDALRRLSKREPSVIERMFATHPMSDERYRYVLQKAAAKYPGTETLADNREAYLDHTQNIRRIAPAIRLMQNGDAAMTAKKFSEALTFYSDALKQVPTDYAGLLSMARCYLAMGKPADARPYVEMARKVLPSEPQAVHIAGLTNLGLRRFAEAHEDFVRYKQMLPGNPNTTFLNGVALEGMGDKEAAAREFLEYLRSGARGEAADYATQRLIQWGFLAPPQTAPRTSPTSGR